MVDSFLGRPLDGGHYPYPYRWLDALTQKVREDGRVVNVSVAVATGVNREGKREVLGIDVGTSEDGSVLAGVPAFAGGPGPGRGGAGDLRCASGTEGRHRQGVCWASWQRCHTHFMTNLLSRVPRRAQP